MLTDLESLYAEPGRLIADGGVVAIPDSGSEIGPPIVARGRADAVSLLNSDRSRWGVPATLLRCARGNAHYLEGSVTTSETVSEVSASVRVASGQVTGLLIYRHPPTPRPQERSTRRAPDPSLAEDAVHRYLANLESGRIDAAAACFTPDAVYSFPPRSPDGARGVAIGREAIHEAFRARGTNTARHQVQTVAAADDGVQYVIDGRVVGLPGGSTASFLSSMSISDEGQITRYIARMYTPEVQF